jgi:hypothetical protein
MLSLAEEEELEALDEMDNFNQGVISRLTKMFLKKQVSAVSFLAQSNHQNSNLELQNSF